MSPETRITFDLSVPVQDRIIWEPDRKSGRCHPVWAETIYDTFEMAWPQPYPSEVQVAALACALDEALVGAPTIGRSER